MLRKLIFNDGKVTSKSDLRKRVVQFLKAKPGATPREIADALGISLNLVRIILSKLRESGIVARGGRGYYVRLSSYTLVEEIENHTKTKGAPFEQEIARVTGISEEYIKTISEIKTSVKNALKAIEELKKVIATIQQDIKTLKQNVENSQTEVNQLKTIINSLKYDMESLKQLIKLPSRAKKEGESDDKFILKLKKAKVMSVDEASKLISKPVDYYINAGKITIISSLVVDVEFFNKFVNKFPISISDLSKLSPEERMLLDEMVRAGYAYLYGGKEYRLIS